MHILITNDDGLWAQGIQALVAAIPADNKVSVVAPASPQSAKGHSLTMHKPLRVTSVESYVRPGVDAWSVSGTPVDCMMLALDELVKERVDVVFSGINHGDNLGDDLPYSGTVSGAYEAFLSGYPSVAFSTAFPRTGSSGFDFSPITWFLQKMLLLIPDLIGNQPAPHQELQPRAQRESLPQRQCPQPSGFRGQGCPGRPSGPPPVRSSCGPPAWTSLEPPSTG